VQRLKSTRQFCAAAFFASGMEARRVKTRRSRGFSAADSPVPQGDARSSSYFKGRLLPRQPTPGAVTVEAVDCVV